MSVEPQPLPSDRGRVPSGADPIAKVRALARPVGELRRRLLEKAGEAGADGPAVSGAIHVTTSRDILAAIARGEGPSQAVMALGYAGWGAGQLEEEIRSNAWLNVPVDPAILFDTPYEDRWRAAMKLLGVDSSRLSTHAGHA